MKFSRLSAAVIAAACIQMSSASAQDVQSQTRGYVEQIALSTGNDNALARWKEDICVGAVGMDANQLQLLVDRVSARARAVGLRPGRPGCRANVMVVYAPDSDAISRQIVDQRRDMLGFYANDNRITAGREAMEEFANTPRPVRWWHVSTSGVGSMRPDAARARQGSGRSMAASAASDSGSVNGDGAATDLQGTDAVRTNASRTRPAEAQNELTYALVIVDARRVANVPPAAWMDYVAFNALAQIDPDARTSDYPTILNLFAQTATAPTQLTAWDTAYLDALYRSRGDSANRQIASIARRLADQVPAQ